MVPFCSGKMFPISRAHLNRLCSWRFSEYFLNISFLFLLFFVKSCTKNIVLGIWREAGGEERNYFKKEEKCVRTEHICAFEYQLKTITKKKTKQNTSFISVAFSVSEMDFIYKSFHTF